jgi:hypothetical protein
MFIIINNTKITEMVETKAEFIQRTNSFKLLELYGHDYILGDGGRTGDKFNVEPNWKNTGLALIGVLKPNETLDDFKKKWITNKLLLIEVDSYIPVKKKKKAKPIIV